MFVVNVGCVVSWCGGCYDVFWNNVASSDRLPCSGKKDSGDEKKCKERRRFASHCVMRI